jgi:hypothetical protein
MIFFSELPKAIKLNAVIAAVGASVFVIGYEVAIFVQAYGAFPLFVFALCLGFAFHMYSILSDRDNHLGIVSTLRIKGHAQFWPPDDRPIASRSSRFWETLAIWIAVMGTLITSPWLGHTLAMVASIVVAIAGETIAGVIHKKLLRQKESEARKNSDERIM